MSTATETNPQPASQPITSRWTRSLGQWTAAAVTILGIVYFLCIVFAALTGAMTLPPPPWLQTAGGLISLASCPLLVVLLAAVHADAPPEKHALSLTALGLTIVFAAFVSINRFTQFGAVRLTAVGEPGLAWFLPYGERSAMLGLEIAGWGWFLGLALLAAAPLFGGWLRRLCVLYAILGIVAAVGFLLASPLSVVGFVAWGFVLFLITGLLAVRFRQGEALAPPDLPPLADPIPVSASHH